MARDIVNDQTNTNPVDADYPRGSVRDKTPSESGTKMKESLYGDMVQFFQKIMAEAGISPNHLPDNEYSGWQLYDALVALIGAPSGNIKTKLVNIGDWNMDSTASVSVAHGLDVTKIVDISVNVRNDSGAGSPLNIPEVNTASDFPQHEGTFAWTSTNVVLTRRTGGTFDAVNYATTSYNRGWILIRYTA